jgi:hypothetical protein
LIHQRRVFLERARWLCPAVEIHILVTDGIQIVFGGRPNRRALVIDNGDACVASLKPLQRLVAGSIKALAFCWLPLEPFAGKAANGVDRARTLLFPLVAESGPIA